MTQTNKSLSRNRRLALAGAFSALIIVLSITNLGFISFSPVISITILQIPVILAATLGGIAEGVFVGAVMGIMSLVKAAMSPSGILDPLFVNPLCSVLPRILLGVAAWFFWKILNFIPKMPKTISSAITGFLATFCHTLMVYGCIFIFKGSDMRAALDQIGMTGVGFFGVVGAGIVSEVFEALASTIVCAAVYAGLFIASSRKSKLSKISQEDDDKKSEDTIL